MSLVKTWYEPQAAAEKFGLSMDQLQTWIDEGLVRFEREKDVLARVNIDDVRLEVEAMVRSQ
jgi:hypothetical protein